MIKSDKIINSANFKKDYIAFFAIFFFFFIVFSEIAVIVGMPIVINYTKLYAETEVQHELIRTFDSIRSEVKTVSVRYPKFANEAQLIAWDMNQIAYWLRENYRELDAEFVAEMLSDMKNYQLTLEKITSEDAKFYLKLKEIDFELLKKNISKKMEQ